MLEIKGSKSGQPAYYKQTSKTSDFWRGLRTIVIVTLIITLILVAAAVIYAWYTSQHAGGNQAAKKTVNPPPALQKPHKPAADAQIGVSRQFLTNPVTPGQNASMSIHTNADARCTITVKYDQTTSTDSGLLPKVADDYGLVEWSWTIPATAPIGDKSSIEVLCANEKKNIRLLEKLTIQAPKTS